MATETRRRQGSVIERRQGRGSNPMPGEPGAGRRGVTDAAAGGDDRVMAQPRLGIYPGTFDPITNGHVDIIGRATRVVDRLVIAVAANPGKDPLFSLQERVEMLQEQVALMRNGDGSKIEVRPFDKLLMHFVEDLGATIILRGLRAVSDFEYEFQMAGMNTRLNPAGRDRSS